MQGKRNINRVSLVHATDEAVDVRLTVTVFTSLDVVVELPLLEATSRARELERPQEHVSSLEVRTHGSNLVDKVFHRDNAILAQTLLDDGVVLDRDTLLVNLGETTLVDELADRLEVRLTPRHVWRDKLKHLLGGSSKLHKHTVVDLAETQELHNLAGLRGNVADTTETDHKSNTGLGRHEEVALRLGQTAQTDLLTLSGLVLLHVLLSTLENNLALLLASLSRLVHQFNTLGSRIINVTLPPCHARRRLRQFDQTRKMVYWRHHRRYKTV